MQSTRNDADARNHLIVYLRDHHAAAQAGRQLASRCAESNRGNELGTYIQQELLPAIDTDRSLVDQAFRAVDAQPSALKDLGARAAEFAGRFKLNGQLTGYSPLSRILELEGLISGVTAKRRLWTVIDQLQRDAVYPALPEVASRIDVANRQVDDLQRFHADALRDAFVPSAAEPSV